MPTVVETLGMAVWEVVRLPGDPGAHEMLKQDRGRIIAMGMRALTVCHMNGVSLGQKNNVFRVSSEKQ